MLVLQAVTNLLNNESVSDIDCLRLVMLYALRYEKESPVQLMQLFNKLASRSPKYKPGVKNSHILFLLSGSSVFSLCIRLCTMFVYPHWLNVP